MHIGLKLRDLARKKNISVSEIAAKLGRSKANIHHTFSGKQDISVSKLEEISIILGVSPAYFWTDHRPGSYGNNEDYITMAKSVVNDNLQAYESMQKDMIAMRKEIDLLEKLLEEKQERIEMYKREISELREDD